MTVRVQLYVGADFTRRGRVFDFQLSNPESVEGTLRKVVKVLVTESRLARKLVKYYPPSSICHPGSG